MRPLRFIAVAAAMLPVLVTPVATATAAPSVVIPTVQTVRAAHHPGFDRFVVEFRGGLPNVSHWGWTPEVTWPQTGKPVMIAGNAFLTAVMTPAQGHNDAGLPTMRQRIAFDLPNLTSMVVTEDWEAHLQIALGVQRQASVTIFRLTSPARVVFDIATPAQTMNVHEYYLIEKNFNAGRQPYQQAVPRPVITDAPIRGALDRLWAGPTRSELAAGLRFVRSETTGFSRLTVSDGIARVWLKGGCNSRGSTFTVANHIVKTLNQFPRAHWVKIYSPWGNTERPTGQVNSIPMCLEP